MSKPRAPFDRRKSERRAQCSSGPRLASGMRPASLAADQRLRIGGDDEPSCSVHLLRRQEARCHLLRAIAFRAASATSSGVKPKCSATTFIGPDIPKLRIAKTTPPDPA